MELEKLKKRLYKAGETFSGRKMPPEFTPLRRKARTKWKEPPQKPSAPKISIFKTIVIILVVLILGLLGLFWRLFLKAPSFSPKNIVFEMNYPEEVKLGELAKFDIKFTNKNELPLTWADIIFQYPKNSKPLNKESVINLRERKKMGDVASGETIEKTFEANIFGEVGEEYEFKATLEFRFEGSNIISEKEIAGKIKIIESPIGINIEGPEELNSGQEFNLQINYLSNSETLFEDLILEAEYPSGFEFQKANPSPDSQNQRWSIGDLSPGEQRHIMLSGILTGNNLEDKYFKIKIGQLNGDKFNVYGETFKTIVIKRGFLEASIIIEDDDKIVSAGQVIKGNIRYKNNLPVSVENVKIELEITGRAVDEKSITVFDGYYLGDEKKIVWQEGTKPELKLLEPGETGELNFQLKVLEKLPVSSAKDKNFTINLKSSISTLKPPLDYQGVDLSSETNYSFKAASEFSFLREGFYYNAQMPNTGPIPPRVGKKTTYTLVFSLINSSNDIKDLEIRSFLPGYMQWENKILPADEDIKYDEITQEIVWKIPRLTAGTGIIKPVKQVMFQVGLTPSPPQINTSPVILGETFVRGTDEFTGQLIEEKKPALTTELRNDPKLNYQDWQVKQ